jgi:hypothetical protein
MSDYAPQVNDKVKDSEFYKFGSFTATVIEVMFGMVRLRMDNPMRSQVVVGNRFIQLVSRPGDEAPLQHDDPAAELTPEPIPAPVIPEAPFIPSDVVIDAQPDEKVAAKKPGSKS